MTVIKIKTAFPYDVHIGRNLSEDFVSFCKIIAKEFVIITDSNVGPLYGKKVQEELTAAGLKVHLFTFQAGEERKTRETKEMLEDQMLLSGLGRQIAVIGLGGGVVTDITGFLASTYLRGVPYIAMPTSLIGMVDAGIGGKTGVNTPKGKNLIGTFYQPKAIFMDIDFLTSLESYDFKEGLVEVIKYGLIKDRDLFERLENSLDDLREPAILETIITESVRIKGFVVENDEKEVTGLRQIINFGHTVGHALESLSKYKMTHGEAVAVGIIAESFISNQMGFLSDRNFQRVQDIFKKLHHEKTLPSFSFKDWVEVMSRDKKSLNNTPYFVLIEEIGKVHKNAEGFSHPVEEEILKKAYDFITC